MNAVFFKIWPLLFVIIYLFLFANFSLAGTCWSTMAKHKTGRCSEFLYDRVSKEDCCSNSTSVSTAWSPDDLDPSSLFFWRTLGGGVLCSSCKESCSNVKCEQEKTCVLRKGIPRCVCSSICKDGRKKPRGPVCGSDGRTYKNWCRMRKKACKQKLRSLSIAYYGECQSSCDKIRCPDGKTCLLDQNGTPHCVHCIKKKCPIVPKHRQVCGSDGLTYRSACHLRNSACHAGKAIPIAYKGPCKESISCHDIHCQDRQQCLLDRSTGGKPRCIGCSTICRQKHLLHRPVCGTNNSTYPTWCHMIKDSCAKGYIIDTKYSGKCVNNKKDMWS